MSNINKIKNKHIYVFKDSEENLEFEAMTKVRNQKIIDKFGQRVRNLREAQNLSQEDLAFAADIPINQIGRIERGEINTTISSIYAIAQALKMKPGDLLE